MIVHDHTDVIKIDLANDGEWTPRWDHSTFPEPLVTVDHDADGRVIGVSFAGPAAEHLREGVQR